MTRQSRSIAIGSPIFFIALFLMACGGEIPGGNTGTDTGTDPTDTSDPTDPSDSDSVVDTADADTDPVRVCAPGDVKLCPCGGGLPDGTQICAADGAAWGTCDCQSTQDSETGDTESDTDTITDTDTDTVVDTASDSGTDTVVDTASDTGSDSNADTGTDTTLSCGDIQACRCDSEVLNVDYYNPSATTTGPAGYCTAYLDAGTLNNCDVSSPQGYYSLTMGGDGYCNFMNQISPEENSKQSGIQMSFYGDGIGSVPKTCFNAAAFQGVRVCVQGSVKNGVPATRFVEKGSYDTDDLTRNPDEIQNMVRVYLVTDYTQKTNAWNSGHCTDDNCTDPFVAMPVNALTETCRNIAWDDFEFPYWWGIANSDFVLPSVCTPPGTVPSGEICRPGEDYDPATTELLAHWHACPAMAQKVIYVTVAAADEIGTDSVEVIDLKARVEFF